MPSNFPDLEKVWKIERKSSEMVKVVSFFESYNKCFISEFFCFGHTLFNLARMFGADHEKNFVPAFFKVSIDQRLDNLESGKRNYCFGKKS